MHNFTKSGNWTLKVEIKYDVLHDGIQSSRAGTWGIGEWDNFAVAAEADKYRLTIGSRTKRENMGSGDPFNTHPLNGSYFSTEEAGRDNDQDCAGVMKGGWWFGGNPINWPFNCTQACLNCKNDYIWSDNYDNWEKPSRSLMWMKKTA